MTVLRTASALRRGLQTSTHASRHFSTSLSRDASWGFIGLGAMGRSNTGTRSIHMLTADRLPHG